MDRVNHSKFLFLRLHIGKVGDWRQTGKHFRKVAWQDLLKALIARGWNTQLHISLKRCFLYAQLKWNWVASGGRSASHDPLISLLLYKNDWGPWKSWALSELNECIQGHYNMKQNLAVGSSLNSQRIPHLWTILGAPQLSSNCSHRPPDSNNASLLKHRHHIMGRDQKRIVLLSLRHLEFVHVRRFLHYAWYILRGRH